MLFISVSDKKMNIWRHVFFLAGPTRRFPLSSSSCCEIKEAYMKLSGEFSNILTSSDHSESIDTRYSRMPLACLKPANGSHLSYWLLRWFASVRIVDPPDSQPINLIECDSPSAATLSLGALASFVQQQIGAWLSDNCLNFLSLLLIHVPLTLRHKPPRRSALDLESQTAHSVPCPDDIPVQPAGNSGPVDAMHRFYSSTKPDMHAIFLYMKEVGPDVAGSAPKCGRERKTTQKKNCRPGV